MGHYNLHFTDREAAQNWADNYGGQFHDNMHTRGEDSGTNFTVREEYDDDGTPFTQTVFDHHSIVYHPVHGIGYVQGKTYDNWIQVIFPKEWTGDSQDSTYAKVIDIDLNNNRLSFKSDMFTQERCDRKYLKYIEDNPHWYL
ncbi:hypothetical protein ACR79K_25275 [Sphingobacterium siyangense]|uniref:hypothetical protein n=1 Tax=Sphingobacterium siyangense TaxID=459529 RepID=UPI003DA6698D